MAVVYVVRVALLGATIFIVVVLAVAVLMVVVIMSSITLSNALSNIKLELNTNKDTLEKTFCIQVRTVDAGRPVIEWHTGRGQLATRAEPVWISGSFSFDVC
ncbi:hypothetical protein RRG08_058524 [Elysia crispata]|uniref:Uncharacterized protein n=1 Tax=Elysia crispata TaxID=231223 RepID=A0AAE1DN75_9GAST|nr:hypothetical protein RRG08_058524 [Elysia crispata]